MRITTVRSSLVALGLVTIISLPSLARAQGAPPARDTAATPRRDTLDAVVVRATRAGGAPPTSQATLDRATIERRYMGQDAPLALQGMTGVTTSSDAGSFSGYSSLRLRGLDQTRLSISLDGVPLNDPEDQVLYFSNVPDFMNSMQSVRLQRGVGASAFGTASYAGSLNFESIAIATTPRFAEAQLTGGSWGTGRASIEGATGLQGAWAGYARVSAQETDGYREHSGNRARSAFASAGWFGARDAVKFTGFAGRSRMQLAYYAPSEADLAANPRVNVMSPLERDDFHQEMASLQHTRAIGAAATLTTTLYRNSAAGAYDVLVGPDLWNFNLAHVWYGALSTFTWSRPGLAVAAGAHLSDYARDHFLFVRPDLATRAYDNTGHKQEQSAFGKVTLTRGTVDWHADVQLRRAAFRYVPTPGSSFGEPSVDWTFVDPKVGVTWRARPGIALFASLGRSAREPARTDLFAGADDVDDATAPDVLPLDRVRPERVTDLEVGARLTSARATVSANAFVMRFHDEIAPIGAIAVTGSPLRQNVGRSERVGLELEGSWLPLDRVQVHGNATFMRARIAEFTDETTATTYRDVPPLLSPAVIANAEVVWTPRLGTFTVALRHVGRSHLANDGNTALVTPAFTVGDLSAALPVGRHALRVQLQNVTDARAYTSGYTDGSTRYLFPLAGRTVLATVVLRF
ncbi:MAG: TonB-dependent receptor [Gemmatimonadetes bacterium]|nr:TonB-dependent receptor [Gemmatimonadota bacterium]